MLEAGSVSHARPREVAVLAAGSAPHARPPTPPGGSHSVPLVSSVPSSPTPPPDAVHGPPTPIADSDTALISPTSPVDVEVMLREMVVHRHPAARGAWNALNADSRTLAEVVRDNEAKKKAEAAAAIVEDDDVFGFFDDSAVGAAPGSQGDQDAEAPADLPAGPWSPRGAVLPEDAAVEGVVEDEKGVPSAILVDGGFSSDAESDSSSGSSQDSWIAPPRHAAVHNVFATSLLVNMKTLVVHRPGLDGRSDCGALRWPADRPQPAHIRVLVELPYQAVQCSKCFT